MRNKKLQLIFILFLFMGCFIFNSAVYGQNEIHKDTFLYAVKGTDSLYLDKYVSDTVSKPTVCVIFLFGGGFVGGERDSEYNAQYMQQLAKKGYVVVGIDYRLGMKDVGYVQEGDSLYVLERLDSAISIAVEDLFDATNFIIKHADQWHVHPEYIIANGSSAGAVTVLQAGYAISNKSHLAERLPKGFNYGGIISFAGAILAEGNDLEWKEKPAPIMMFHGDGDQNVPYGKAWGADYGFYGSAYIAKQFHENQFPYYFYDVKNFGHEIAGSPMTHNLDEIESFILYFVKVRKQWMLHTVLEEAEKPVAEKNFDMIDYMKYNYMPR